MQKHKLKRNIQKGLSIVATGVVILTSSSCSKSENKTPTVPNNPSLISVKDDWSGKIHDYQYLVDISKVLPEYGYNLKGIQLFEVIDSKAYSTEYIDKSESVEWSWSKIIMIRKILSQPKSLVIPDCYLHFVDGSMYQEKNGELVLKDTEKWRWLFENTKSYYKEELIGSERFNKLKLVYSRIEFEKDITRRDKTYYNQDEPIYKGDTLESYALYLSNNDGECIELIGFYQIGAGANCENVQSEIVGDFPSTITTIENAQIIKEPVTLTEDERSSLEANLDDSEINQNGIIVSRGRSK